MQSNQGQDNILNEELPDKTDALNSKNDREGGEEWLDEHGHPDFTYLQSLVDAGDPASLEKLQSIAEDLNVEYDSNNSAQELVERINAAAEEDDGSEFTV